MLCVRTSLHPSGIHGLGLFAAEPIAAGTVIWRETPWSVTTYAPEDVAHLPPVFQQFVHTYAYLWQGRYVLGFDDSRFMNHSEASNTRNGEDLTTTVAVRDIAFGDELTCDYREFDDDLDRKLRG